mgnify:CR=1 FL=1
MKKSLTQISLIVPAHNEQESLSPLIREAQQCYEKFGIDGEIVIVDDGSTDQTSSVAEQLCERNIAIKFVRLKERSGKTHALKAGFHLASGDVAVFVDADRQYDLEDMRLLYAPILSNKYDLVNGYRVKRQDSTVRRIQSRAYNRLNRWVFHVKTRDSNSGFKAMRREVFLAIEPFLKKDFHRYMVSIAGYVGYRILEVPISHYPRSAGKSKYSSPARLTTGLMDMLRVRWRLQRFRNSVKTY